jgi:hypothetical protein
MPKRKVIRKLKLTATDKFPRHSVSRALRIPKAIIDQNAGRECSEADAAKFVGVGLNGPFRVEISSAIKYGLLDRPASRKVAPTELARRAIRPQKPGDEIEALRECVTSAPTISEVYAHYRGENLPDGAFFDNALVDKFGISPSHVSRFKEIFNESLRAANLLATDKDNKARIIDISGSNPTSSDTGRLVKKADIKVANTGETCFVVMPFSPPIGEYYEKIYSPAIQKAGLNPIRADADIFGSGKIIDQIWHGINGEGFGGGTNV